MGKQTVSSAHERIDGHPDQLRKSLHMLALKGA